MSQKIASRSLLFRGAMLVCMLAWCGHHTVLAQNSVRGETPSYSARVTNQAVLDELDLCEGLVSDLEVRRVKPVARPPFGKRYRDPAFGTTVIRITNSSVDEVYKPAYSTMQAWNADESLLLLYRQTAANADHLLLDGFSYKPIAAIDLAPSDLEEIFWSHSDPDTLYYISKAQPNYGDFMKMNVRSGKKTLVRSFDEVCGVDAVPTVGDGVHMQSYDDDVFGFRCESGENWTMFNYRISTDEIVSKPLGPGTPFSHETAPIPLSSGELFWQQGKILQADLTTVAAELDMLHFHEHGDLGVSWDGREVLFVTAFEPSKGGCDGDIWKGVGHVIEHDLRTAKCRAVINEADGYPYTTRGTHISGRAIRKPGWVAMSSIGDDRLDLHRTQRPAPVLFSEIYLVDTRPESERVCRVAQHRSFAKSAENGDYHPYFGEPHATISPSGTRILFGSDWYDSGSVDAYVVELPAYQTLIQSE